MIQMWPKDKKWEWDCLVQLKAEEDQQMDYAFSVLEMHETYDPVSISEIENRGDRNLRWKAMDEEINSLNESHTWTMVKLPKNAKTIKTK